MLNASRQNYHHSKLPQPGAVVVVKDRPLAPGRRYRRFIVEGFPLTDSQAYRGHFYSIGIHTCHIRALDNGEQFRVSGFLCEVTE